MIRGRTGSAQVPSPLKNVVLFVVPVADRAALIVPATVMGPPVKLIKEDDTVDIDVTVPILREAIIVLATSLTKKLRVTLTLSLSVPII